MNHPLVILGGKGAGNSTNDRSIEVPKNYKSGGLGSIYKLLATVNGKTLLEHQLKTYTSVRDEAGGPFFNPIYISAPEDLFRKKGEFFGIWNGAEVIPINTDGRLHQNLGAIERTLMQNHAHNLTVLATGDLLPSEHDIQGLKDAILENNNADAIYPLVQKEALEDLNNQIISYLQRFKGLIGPFFDNVSLPSDKSSFAETEFFDIFKKTARRELSSIETPIIDKWPYQIIYNGDRVDYHFGQVYGIRPAQVRWDILKAGARFAYPRRADGFVKEGKRKKRSGKDSLWKRSIHSLEVIANGLVATATLGGVLLKPRNLRSAPYISIHMWPYVNPFVKNPIQRGTLTTDEAERSVKNVILYNHPGLKSPRVVVLMTDWATLATDMDTKSEKRALELLLESGCGGYSSNKGK